MVFEPCWNVRLAVAIPYVLFAQRRREECAKCEAARSLLVIGSELFAEMRAYHRSKSVRRRILLEQVWAEETSALVAQRWTEET